MAKAVSSDGPCASRSSRTVPAPASKRPTRWEAPLNGSRIRIPESTHAFTLSHLPPSVRLMRIALFSEVYWPMVSGVGVTVLRLTRALEERGRQVRVYAATYSLPKGQPDRPEVHRSASVPLFLYQDVQWAFPRVRDVLEDATRFRPDVIHVATEFALGITGLKVARHLNLPVIASAHTDYDKYARYGVDWVLRAGWRYLR